MQSTGTKRALSQILGLRMVLFLPFLHHPSTGSKQTQIGGSTGGENMVTDGSCDGMNYVKNTMAQYNTVTSENGRKRTMRCRCK
eukprot:4639581-Ditylum_brightwellii.AAC.1